MWEEVGVRQNSSILQMDGPWGLKLDRWMGPAVYTKPLCSFLGMGCDCRDRNWSVRDSRGCSAQKPGRRSAGRGWRRLKPPGAELYREEKAQGFCILGQVWGLLPRGLCQKARTEGQGLPKAVWQSRESWGSFLCLLQGITLFHNYRISFFTIEHKETASLRLTQNFQFVGNEHLSSLSLPGFSSLGLISKTLINSHLWNYLI